MSNTTKCPVCGLTLLKKIALKNHIINSGMGEVWRYATKQEKKEMPHAKYYAKHVKKVKLKKFVI